MTTYGKCPECGIHLGHKETCSRVAPLPVGERPDVPMIPADLRKWLSLRGVADDRLDEFAEMFQGKSLDEMNTLYDAMHGDGVSDGL